MDCVPSRVSRRVHGTYLKVRAATARMSRKQLLHLRRSALLTNIFTAGLALGRHAHWPSRSRELHQLLVLKLNDISSAASPNIHPALCQASTAMTSVQKLGQFALSAGSTNVNESRLDLRDDIPDLLSYRPAMVAPDLSSSLWLICGLRSQVRYSSWTPVCPILFHTSD